MIGISILRRRRLLLKAVLLLTALWFLATLATVEFEERANKILKSAETLQRKSKVYGIHVPNVPAVLAALYVGNVPGEFGKPVYLPKNIRRETSLAVQEGWKLHSFNQYVSDLISIRRKLPDLRDEWCKKPGKYLKDLPETSVVICFYNEAWSVLLRTVHSVLDRSPPHLIKEVILVDDGSNMTHLLQQLDDYMSNLPKVRIVRTNQRYGLTRARLLGARYVTAPVLTYLDSHCECTEGWLEPLLDRIARNSTTVVCPDIDTIDDNTFEYIITPELAIGGFDWDLQFHWQSVPYIEKAKHKHPAEPVWSPTISGGIFAIDKDFFEKIGTYDSAFDIWGGENLELSFKTWMCGGTLEIIPCSHVGHVFRETSPYQLEAAAELIYKNHVRLAEVWLDEYKKYFYETMGTYNKGDYGDISSRIQLRKELGCKSFRWYLTNINPQMRVPQESVASGEIRNKGFKEICLDSLWNITLYSDSKPGLYPCHQNGGHQFWLYSKSGEIRQENICLDYSGFNVAILPCHGAKGNQLWLYDWKTKLIIHGPSEQCMAAAPTQEKLLLENCDATELRQQWYLQNFSPHMFKDPRPKLVSLTAK